MKIVRIIARLNVGGPARHVVWLSSALADDEFESVLLAGAVPDGEEDMSYFAAQHNVKPIFIEEMSRELSLKDIISLWKVYRRLLSEKPDILHTHTAKAGTIGRVAGFLYRWLSFGALIGKPRKLKVLHTFHGHIFHSYYGKFKTALFLFIEKCLAKFATDKIIVISGQQKKEIHEEFGIGREDQFEIVKLGLDLKPFQKNHPKSDYLRKRRGAEREEIFVGLIGRLTEIKNHDLFLRTAKVYKEYREKDLPRIRFIIIGDGHLREWLEKKAAEYGVEDIAQFLGNREDAAGFYAGLDIVALTSLNEGTPLTLIEAMASGKPVISTSVGGVVDLLGEKIEEREKFVVCERGVRVTSKDEKDYFSGLSYLIRNAGYRNESAERGKIYAAENYDKRRLIREISALYRDLVKN